jgi:leucyl-tRNA synthetase
MKYNPKSIEKKWQKFWLEKKTFIAKDASKKKKKYVLVEFPYPSGAGLHMGHLRSYVAADVYSRFQRLRGYEVMYPIGWDAFGLPAENYAIKHGIHPSVATAKNIKNFTKQINELGVSFDWSREVNTTDPDYYKWTQWLFLQFFKKGLAYESTGLINWCPKDKTGLANEEVIAGKCERCGTEVEKKELTQWYLKITAYAEKLLQGLQNLPDWPDRVKLQQENWIGKSVGAEIDFPIKNSSHKVKVFTTRPDTIFGATYLVLAPEHPFVTDKKLAFKNVEEVVQYIEQSSRKQEIERTSETLPKTGVQLKGVEAINPATGKSIPVWVGDYVLGSYGTGAIMAVPAHDKRDEDFAKKYALPIKQVIGAKGLVNSGKFNGMSSEIATLKMAEEFGKMVTRYKLRDWVFSRQRYWGEPIPIIHCDDCGAVAVPDKDLPVTLPNVKKYEPTGSGQSPLAGIDSWVNVKCPQCKKPAKRETNTMPQWAGSSWYFLRYADPKNKKAFADKEKLKHWMPVDVYFGGMEHTTLHLLYSRFWNLFFYDQKLVPVKEPYTKRVPHGIILAADGEKMSKSRGNVVNPDDMVKLHGADTLRMYELFLGPHETEVSWNENGIVGTRRFLEKLWYWAQDKFKDQKAKFKDTENTERALHKLIKKVTEDIEGFHFNTCISAFMEFLSEVKDEAVSKESALSFLTLLYPFAPHITEEIHQSWGGKGSLQAALWPKFDPKKIIESFIEVVVQINGKVRDHISVAPNAAEEEVKKAVMELPKIKESLEDKQMRKFIYVPGRLVNIVVTD